MFKWRGYPVTKSCIKIRISLIDLRAVHTTPEELYKEGLTLKRIKSFFVQTTPVKFQNATSICHFTFVFEQNPGRGIS